MVCCLLQVGHVFGKRRGKLADDTIHGVVSTPTPTNNLLTPMPALKMVGVWRAKIGIGHLRVDTNGPSLEP